MSYEIASGSKTFHLASLFFAPDVQEDCRVLYRWCRRCDDAVDEAAGNDAQASLTEIKRKTFRALRGEPSEPFYASLGDVCRRRGISADLFQEMIAGFETDAHFTGIKDFAALDLYAYRVAGVVGLMMSGIMRVEDPAATRHAVSLGKAMQFTNIARDIREDAERGRVYLPVSWLNNGASSFDLVKRLLAKAEILYDTGFEGLRYLKFRSAIAVGAAALFYRAIGREILRVGPRALEQRVTISFTRKCLLLPEAFFRVLASRFKSSSGRRDVARKNSLARTSNS